LPSPNNTAFIASVGQAMKAVLNGTEHPNSCYFYYGVIDLFLFAAQGIGKSKKWN